MQDNLIKQLKTIIQGDVLSDDQTLNLYSHDASLFEVEPQVVVFPKDIEDIKKLVKYASDNKKNNPSLSLTGRSAGTDMGGGAINDSIIVEFNKYFNHTPIINNNIATTEPGVFYRDFEKETLKYNLIFPSYPASKELCAMGGIISNNAGGEKSLEYGKTEKYVKKIKIVLSDGNEYIIKPLNEKELQEKLKLNNFEGNIYRKIHNLISENYEIIENAKPSVSKNSAGYSLWNIWNKEDKIFDLTQLFVGAQGTLGLITQAEFELVPIRKHREMVILFLRDLSHLEEIIDTALMLQPESFESYDDNTLKLSLRYFPEFAHQLGFMGLIQSGFAFLPAFLRMLIGKLPKLILQIDFTSNDTNELQEKIAILREKLKPFHPQTRIAIDDAEKKYWLIRRESFNLLRNKIRNKHTAPFIDDFVIDPHQIAEVLPQIIAVLKKNPEFIFTVAGHIGNGNFHIIPLADIKDKKVRNAIPVIAGQVYDIIAKYHGSITGEHNDGLIRTPYLKQMYGQKIVTLFEETKKIFDPQNIFNPRKKVFGDLDFAMSHIRQSW